MESSLERVVGLKVTLGLLPSFNQLWSSSLRIFAQVSPAPLTPTRTVPLDPV